MMNARLEQLNAALKFARLPVALAATLVSAASMAASVTYTLNAHFDLGVLQNVNHDIADQLQLNKSGVGFPVLWIANAGEDTLSKFDTTQVGASPGREVGRYYTWFSEGVNSYGDHGAWSGPAPSRTAVDVDGNAYVLNRHFDGRPALLIKILANSYIDRNGNGVEDTSTDANNNGVIEAGEMKPLIDTNANGIIDPGEIQDERIAWVVRVPDGTPAFPLESGNLGRALCIGTDGNLWVGLYSSRRYYKVNAATGATLAGPISTTPTAGNPSVGSWSPYGCLIDRNGVLWSASLGSILGKIENTADNDGPWPVSSFSYRSNYGIALGRDAGDGHTLVYLGGGGDSFSKFDSATNTFSSPAAVYYSSLGVNTDGDGNILVSKSSGGVAKFTPAGALIWDKPAQAGTATDSRGIMPDSVSDVWQTHLGTSKISKFKKDDGTALGVLPSGLSPYTYSDASGFAAANITVSTGTWSVVQDGGAAGTDWGKVSWSASVPGGGSVTGRVRTADTLAALPAATWLPVTSGVGFAQTGRYIEAEVRLNANTDGDSPIVFDITIATADTPVCDVNADGAINQLDLKLISAARGQTATAGDPRDSDFDGKITPNDVKACIPKCTLANCAVN
jgi:hypothetical protein